MRINTNIPAIQSYNALTSVNNRLAKSVARLSTGLRINSAADDAAGLAISEKMRAQYRGLDQASNNAQDAISMVQTAEGALGESHSILQRMRELAVQAANDTLTQEDRSYIQLEIDQLKDEIDRISTTTQFNKRQLLDGSAAATWSSDNLSTKAIINGGLREIDQFGQKNIVEGNFKITVRTTPGQSQASKSNIFRIKHPNVIMDVVVNKENGLDQVRVDTLPAGNYTLKQKATTDAVGNLIGGNNAGGMVSKFGTFSDDFLKANIANVEALKTDAAGTVLTAGGTVNVNMSLLFEVKTVDSAGGQVVFHVRAVGVDANGNSTSYNGGELIVTTAGIMKGTYANLGLSVTDADNFVIGKKSAIGENFAVGSKAVIQLVANSDIGLVVSGHMNADWQNAWGTKKDGYTDATLKAGYGFSEEIIGKEVHMKQFYLNTANGTVHEGDVIATFNEKLSAGKDIQLASFEAAYVGQVAKGDVQLRDLDNFWDANGKFILQDPKTIDVIQGDGKKASVTIYSTDTINDVRQKLNDAIADGLGQGRYCLDSRDKFVSFVEDPAANTSESVAGTFVMRSIVPGTEGKLTLSGDEDMIRAFSLNTIQEAKESRYTVSINDAHSGNVIANNVSVSGNRLVGVLHKNIDVVFDSMANIQTTWQDSAKRFQLLQDTAVYTSTLHISSNTTVFQIGANEGEDMGIDIGEMSADSLGISKINVTDRESAARAITIVDNAINRVSSQRAKLGAYQNRLEHTINNLTTASTNLKSSESRIRDADMAKEMMEFTKLNILSQAGNSMLAQANQLPQNVLTLLR